MYKNLKAEMIKQDISIKDIASLLNIKVDTARLKVNGKIPLRMSECQEIASLFTNSNSIDYLFSNEVSKTNKSQNWQFFQF